MRRVSTTILTLYLVMPTSKPCRVNPLQKHGRGGGGEGAPATLRSLPPNPHGIISFTDPHPLTLLESYRFKNIGGSHLLNSSSFLPSIGNPERLGSVNFQPSHPSAARHG